MMKRLAREVAGLERGDLSGMGIYTWFDEANLRRGRAMLIGPADTPYAFCPLFFSITVPPEYPLVPPQVRIDTSDGVSRLHPNLYTTGKVCLSILGTYSGPSWVSTMNIETVLKSIYSLLNDNPIVNEPGWERYTLANPRAKEYADKVQFSLGRLTLEQYRAFKAAGGHPLWDPFRDVILGHWEKTCLPALSKVYAKRAAAAPVQEFREPTIYAMRTQPADWQTLAAAAAANLSAAYT
jgi:ubiquitin-protein ligase